MNLSTPTGRNTMNDLQRLVPEGTTHFTIEERQHRGSTVYAVVAIVPDGAAIPLNGYSTRELAESTAQNLRAKPTTPTAKEILQHHVQRLVAAGEPTFVEIPANPERGDSGAV
jgi:hypothetical protein